MNKNDSSKDTFTGFALAVALTVIPFLTVLFKPFPRETIFAIIAGTALVQIIVHLRFFLGIRLRRSSPDNVFPLLFALVLFFIMVGGTLWIMGNLNYRMEH